MINLVKSLKSYSMVLTRHRSGSASRQHGDSGQARPTTSSNANSSFACNADNSGQITPGMQADNEPRLSIDELRRELAKAKEESLLLSMQLHTNKI